MHTATAFLEIRSCCVSRRLVLAVKGGTICGKVSAMFCCNTGLLTQLCEVRLVSRQSLPVGVP